MTIRTKNTLSCLPALLLAFPALAEIASDAPVRGIMDNSFFVEEAYNQEAGVVQHILTMNYAVDRMSGPDDRALELAFTQEWALFSQTHQIGFSAPYLFVESGGQSVDGFGDMSLDYRWQAYFNEDTLTAFAPRFSLILPTGDESKGLGDDTLGYELNLPFSTALNDRWFAHANAGLTFLPDAGPSPSENLLHYNVGASAIYACNERLHLMLEWVGTWEESPSGGGTDRDFASIISPGARYAFDCPNDAQLVLGLAAPIGLNNNAPDIGVFFYVSFEHGFLPKSQE